MRAISLLAFGLLTCGCDSAAPTKKATEPEPVVAKAKPNQKAVKAEQPKEESSNTAATPKKAPTFDEAWETAVKVSLPKAKQKADAGFAARQRLFTKEELATIDGILKRADDRGALTSAELVLVLKYDVIELVGVSLAQRSSQDPVLKRIAEAVWNRTPKTRDSIGLVVMMAGWGNLDEDQRVRFREVFDAVEGKRRVFTTDERDLVLKVAGEAYWLNRP